MSYQYILFDFDGCLLNSLGSWLQAYKETFPLFGVQNISDRDIVGKVFGDWNAPSRFGVVDLKGFNAYLIPRVQELLQQAKLHDGVLATLETLKLKEKGLALVTSSARTLIQSQLKRLNMEKIFGVIVCAEDVVHHKPDPESVLMSIAKLGATPTKSLLVGDYTKDVQAGINAGVDTVLFFPEENKRIYPKELFEGLTPTYTIDKFEDLLGITR